MTYDVRHATTIAELAGGLVSGTEWDAGHDATMQTARVLGRVSAGGGPVEELTATQLAGLIGPQAPAPHTHVIADVTGLQTALNVLAPLASPVFTGNPTAPTPTAGDNDTSLATTAFVTAAVGVVSAASVVTPVGQCRLNYVSASAIRLDPYRGNRLFINGKNELIPSGGVQLASTGLAAATTYNVYAYMSGTTMMLEASATARATSALSGMQIKSGDETRALVGKIWTDNTSSFYNNNPAQLSILNWFNQLRFPMTAALASDYSQGAGPFNELTALRMYFLSWGEEAVQPEFCTTCRNTFVATNYFAVGLGGAWHGVAYTDSFQGVQANSVSRTRPATEGFIQINSGSGISGGGPLVHYAGGYTYTQAMVPS